MKVLNFMGSVLYSVIMSYLMWLFFYWITPIAMSINWFWFVVYVGFAGGFLSLLTGSVASLLAVPILFLSKKCKAAMYAPIPFLLFFGYSSVRLPWNLEMDFGVLQWIISVSLAITIAISFISLIVMPFQAKK